MPVTPKLSPAIARILLEENIETSATVVSLTSEEYVSVIKEAAHLGLSGGIVYDALILKTAQKAKVKHLLTFNIRDFHRLSPGHTDFIISP